MNPIITLITPTGGRPEAFAQCEYYIKNQTVFGASMFPLQWIVIDDCTPPTKCNLGQEYHRGTKLWEPGVNTQRYNMDQAISFVKGDYIFIIEDDDYYAPTYLGTMLKLLKVAPVVGEGVAKYYNIRVPGHKVLNNYKNSSLCQTGITKEYVPLLYQAVHSGELYFDVKFWDMVKERKIPTLLMWNLDLCIGIKGMPGRVGISGHGHEDKGYYFDSNFSKLKTLVGSQAAQFYIGVADAINRQRPKNIG